MFHYSPLHIKIHDLRHLHKPLPGSPPPSLAASPRYELDQHRVDEMTISIVCQAEDAIKVR